MTVTTLGPATGQFLRFAQLAVSSGDTGPAIILSSTDATDPSQSDPIATQLRFRFEIRQNDAETPNTATIRVFNVAPTTANTIMTKPLVGDGFSTVYLTAGYVNGNQGVIFRGTIKQFRFGRERNVDSYLDILAADGDLGYNFGVVNQTFPAGFPSDQELSTYAMGLGVPVAKDANNNLLAGGIVSNPRGKVAFGLARQYVRDRAHTGGARWSIQNGVLTVIPNTGYLFSESIVAINSATGMLGTPEATDQGVMTRCYLNPLIKVGQRVQVNNADINQTLVESQFFRTYSSQYYPATTANDGIYRVMVVEHVGDTRSNDWTTELTCLYVDGTSNPATSVQKNG